jgi:hypothetical protein
MRGCQRVDALTAWSTVVTTLPMAPVVEAAAGTELPTWLAAVVTDVPRAVTVLPTVDATGARGATGLPPPAGAGVPVPPPPPAELPDEAAGEPGAPVKVAAPVKDT